MKSLHFIFTTVIMAVGLSACSSDESEDVVGNNERVSIPMTRAEQELAKGNVEFSLDLLCKVDKTQNDNYVISPLSLNHFLAVVANGAAGETAEEINGILKQTVGDSDANSFFQRLMTTLPKLDKQTKVVQANSLWIQDNINLAPSFRTASEALGTEIYPYSSSEAGNLKSKIDSWCSKKTDKLITNLPATNLFPVTVVNATYFKSKWHEPFDKALTKRESFYGTNGNSTCDMMHNPKLIVGLAMSPHFTGADLTFGNGAYSMLLVMPDENVSDAEACRTLMEEWHTMVDKPSREIISIGLPKFSIETTIILNDALSDMGMKQAFTQKADFSGVSTNGGFGLELLLQKSVVKVEEKGVEAAAVDANSFSSCTFPNNNHAITFNRPFFFIIRELSTGVILFAGKINNL